MFSDPSSPFTFSMTKAWIHILFSSLPQTCTTKLAPNAVYYVSCRNAHIRMVRICISLVLRTLPFWDYRKCWGWTSWPFQYIPFQCCCLYFESIENIQITCFCPFQYSLSMLHLEVTILFLLLHVPAWTWNVNRGFHLLPSLLHRAALLWKEDKTESNRHCFQLGNICAVQLCSFFRIDWYHCLRKVRGSSLCLSCLLSFRKENARTLFRANQ